MQALSNKPIKVVQVSLASNAGGAERSASNLHQSLRESGLDSWMVVGRNSTNDQQICAIENDKNRNHCVRGINYLLEQYDQPISKLRGAGRVLRGIRSAAEPIRMLSRELGVEDFSYPGTRQMMDRHNDATIIHCHNLHGEYFDLNVLPELCQRSSVILNIRDAWLLTGHCAMPMECVRWINGCGQCPDLNRYPAVRRDATAFNWKRKQKIFSRCKFYVTTPSKWMRDQVMDSMLSTSVIDARVIPNGIDDRVFFPGDRLAARKKLGLNPDTIILMTAGVDVRHNAWKNFPGLLESINILTNTHPDIEAILLVIGSKAKVTKIGKIVVRYIPFIANNERMADHYRAADIYLHSARIESFGNVLAEAKACATAVVAPAVGGIPEHVKTIERHDLSSDIECHDIHSSHGILTKPGDPNSMAVALKALMENKKLRDLLGKNAAQDAKVNFTLTLQTRRFIEWYTEIITASNSV